MADALPHRSEFQNAITSYQSTSVDATTGRERHEAGSPAVALTPMLHDVIIKCLSRRLAHRSRLFSGRVPRPVSLG